MSIHDATKLTFENALRKLLNTTSFNKITIQNITELSKSTRQTFYYHFKDKYDLVAWIYLRQTAGIVNKFPEIPWIDVIIENFRKIEEDDLFFSKVLVNGDHNSLVNYMVTYDVKVYRSILSTLGGIKNIDDQLAFDIEFHAFACTHMTQLWIKKKVREHLK